MLVGNASIVILVVVTACLHASIPWQDVVSLLSILPWISCLGRASFSKISLNCSSWLVSAVSWGFSDWARVGKPGKRSSFEACRPIISLS
jgi:hypothetical protein